MCVRNETALVYRPVVLRCFNYRLFLEDLSRGAHKIQIASCISKTLSEMRYRTDTTIENSRRITHPADTQSKHQHSLAVEFWSLSFPLSAGLVSIKVSSCLFSCPCFYLGCLLESSQALMCKKTHYFPHTVHYCSMSLSERSVVTPVSLRSRL